MGGQGMRTTKGVYPEEEQDSDETEGIDRLSER